jgi:diguanylate cyclase (GGDEF)-like protein
MRWCAGATRTACFAGATPRRRRQRTCDAFAGGGGFTGPGRGDTIVRGHCSVSDTGRQKTVVTVISRISEKPAAKEACLVVIYGLDLGKKYHLDRPSVILGRSSKADIQIDQESVSRNHCKIINTGNSILLRDLGSTNGTYVNDELVDEYVLRDGDYIKIGRCIFKFLSGNNIENAYHEEIYRLTTIDGLTQVYNKRYFLETLEREIGRAQRYRRDLSLILFDIDKFKDVNDQYGHLAGDHVLKQLASVIKARIRREDMLSRYGGEEFAIILPEIDNHNAFQFAEKIRALVEKASFKFEDTLIPVTISIGIASIATELQDPQEFIRQADTNLYQAKDLGRNQVVG